jgi:hypothetical protein
MAVISNFITNNFSLLISLISLTISLTTAFRTWWAERFKLDFHLVKWFGYADSGYPFYLWLTVMNNSKLPCSILEVTVEYRERDGQITNGIGRGSGILFSTTNKGKERYSLDLPQNIDAYSSIGGYFHILSTYSFYAFEERNVQITIKTNRGTVTKNVFLDMGKNIYRVLQYKDPANDVKIEKREDGSKITYINDGL